MVRLMLWNSALLEFLLFLFIRLHFPLLIQQLIEMSRTHSVGLSPVIWRLLFLLDMTLADNLALNNQNQSINQSISQTINQFVSQLNNQSVNQSVNHSVSPLISRLVCQLVS